MLGIGTTELIVILLVALVVVGPKKLPDLAKNLGKSLRNFKQASDNLKDSLQENETFQGLQEIKGTVKETMDALNPSKLMDRIDPLADSKVKSPQLSSDSTWPPTGPAYPASEKQVAESSEVFSAPLSVAEQIPTASSADTSDQEAKNEAKTTPPTDSNA